MLFNSYPFIFLFLPIALVGYFWLGRRSNLAPVIWLALASLAFYSVSNWRFVTLLLGSIAFNYFVGYLLIAKKLSPRARFAVLTAGVAGDLLLLGIFKYAGFFAANVNTLFATHFTVNILLPIGISFYTFTQIAFLVDAWRGEVARLRPGPLRPVRHLLPAPDRRADPAPQGDDAAVRRRTPAGAPAADDPGCRAHHLHHRPVQEGGAGRRRRRCSRLSPSPRALEPGLVAAWTGTLAYTLQLYFDFSGYSDMAIGLSRMFGIDLPLNFNSPLQGHQHHRVLAPLAHDAVALPARLSLHPARRQPPRPRAAATPTCWPPCCSAASGTAPAGHSCVWGALHGVYLCINHAWNNFGPEIAPRFQRAANIVAFLLTFLAVVVAWVFFRADNMQTALSVLSKMADPGNIALGRAEIAYALFILGYAAIAWFAPNTQEIMGYDHQNRKVGERLNGQRMRPLFLYATAAVLAFGILGIQQHSEFIYFRF